MHLAQRSWRTLLIIATIFTMNITSLSIAQVEPLLSNIDSTHINKELQDHLNNFIKKSKSPITGIAISEISTGKIIAMAEGRDPTVWGKSAHTNIYPYFPTASLYKTIVAAAAIEELKLDPEARVNLWTGCQFIQASGVWLKDSYRSKKHQLSFKQAYGKSCNNFFAKLIVEKLGLNIVKSYTDKFGWNSPLQSDFSDQAPTIFLPEELSSNIQSVGRFGAGFGKVYTSVLHQLWIMNMIGNNGLAKQLNLYKQSSDSKLTRIIEEDTAKKLQNLMSYTVRGGTSTSNLRRRKYRSFRKNVGGKSGTLSGSNPKGINSWFAGLYPIDNPKYAISAVTVLEDIWHFRAADLFAESVFAIRKHVDNPNKQVAVTESDKKKF